MEEKRLGGRIGMILGWGLAILVGILLALATYIGFFADRLLPGSWGRQLSPMVQREMGQALPEGSLAVVDLKAQPAKGEVAAYRDDQGRMLFGRVTDQQQDLCLVKGDLEEKTQKLQRQQLSGTVHFYISRLGGLVTMLANYRLTVAATAAVYILVLLAALFTRGRRRRARRRRELIELFAFYGEKYDMEESDIDY